MTICSPLTRDRSVQDACSCARSNQGNKLELDLIDIAKLPLGGAKGFLEVIYDENIGRMDKLSGSCSTTEAGPLYGMGIVKLGPYRTPGQKLFDLAKTLQKLKFVI